jgi:hypothetical protein
VVREDFVKAPVEDTCGDERVNIANTESTLGNPLANCHHITPKSKAKRFCEKG